ncbi:ITA7 protein, partial [Mionectes macconnelli]|nr:ITA7 protein [Mionectes macconnelli]
QEFLDVSSLELIVRAEVSIISSSKNLVLKDAATQMSVSIHLDPGVAVAGVPWWVVPLAVLVGILVLALLVLGLWKVRDGPPCPTVTHPPHPLTCPPMPQVGFFRRARRAPPAVPQYHAVRIPREQR